MIQPYGAFFMGSICGVVSTLGYRLLQVSDTLEIIPTSFYYLNIFDDPRAKYNLLRASFQEKLSTWLKLHDTCGVNNLHGMPGIISGLASIFMILFATEDVYGPR